MLSDLEFLFSILRKDFARYFLSLKLTYAQVLKISVMMFFTGFTGTVTMFFYVLSELGLFEY